MLSNPLEHTLGWLVTPGKKSLKEAFLLLIPCEPCTDAPISLEALTTRLHAQSIFYEIKFARKINNLMIDILIQKLPELVALFMKRVDTMQDIKKDWVKPVEAALNQAIEIQSEFIRWQDSTDFLDNTLWVDSSSVSKIITAQEVLLSGAAEMQQWREMALLQKALITFFPK